jgi:hypothetical protein
MEILWRVNAQVVWLGMMQAGDSGTTIRAAMTFAEGFWTATEGLFSRTAPFRTIDSPAIRCNPHFHRLAAMPSPLITTLAIVTIGGAATSMIISLGIFARLGDEEQKRVGKPFMIVASKLYHRNYLAWVFASVIRILISGLNSRRGKMAFAVLVISTIVFGWLLSCARFSFSYPAAPVGVPQPKQRPISQPPANMVRLNALKPGLHMMLWCVKQGPSHLPRLICISA